LNFHSRSGSRDDTDFALLENVSWHDTHFAALANDTWAVSANHSRGALRLESVEHSDLVTLGDTLGDGDDELNLILDSLDDCVRGERGWDVDDRSVGLSVLDSVGDGSEDGETEVLSAGFLKRQQGTSLLVLTFGLVPPIILVP
jgi:hypothetical protein